MTQEFSMMLTFVLVKKGKKVDKVVGAKKDEPERRVRNMIAILVL